VCIIKLNFPIAYLYITIYNTSYSYMIYSYLPDGNYNSNNRFVCINCIIVCSSSSNISTKYDPDLLKSDVAHARERVTRLKRELEQIGVEMSCTRRGVETLSKYVSTIYNMIQTSFTVHTINIFKIYNQSRVPIYPLSKCVVEKCLKRRKERCFSSSNFNFIEILIYNTFFRPIKFWFLAIDVTVMISYRCIV